MCVFVHVFYFHLHTCVLSKAGQGLLICKLSVFSHKSKSNLYLCGSLRVRRRDGKSERDGERCEMGVGGEESQVK